MNEGRDLWQKYCGFFDKDFSEQVKYSEKKKEEYFRKWKKTKMAKQLCPKGARVFEDIPLTTYDDYPILHKFGKKIEKLEKTVPRNKGELWWDYYDRIGRQVSPMLDGWMVDDYAMCLKTSGSSGKSKWFVHGKTYLENAGITSVSVVLLACADHLGKPKIEQGDTILNLMAPMPYGSGVAAWALGKVFKLVPPIEILDTIIDMRKKLTFTLKYIEKAHAIDCIAGAPSSLRLICQYFTEPKKLWKDRYQSFSLGMIKFILYLKYLQAKRKSKKYEKMNDLFPIKGLVSCAWDGTVYLDYLKEQFNIDPFNLYAASDTLLPLMGRPHRKFDLFPTLSNAYLEFVDDKGQIKKINELTKNEIYELIVTTFGSLTLRYQMGDLFRVIDFEDDGMPIFRFESRKVGMIDIYGYFRLSEALVRDAMIKAGFPPSEKWSVCQEMMPKEHFHILMEKESEYSEKEAAKLIFESLRKIHPDFNSYVRDFNIREPSEAIGVDYLNKGAFIRYTMKKAKEGLPFGQIKPPKIIGPERHEIADLLRRL